MCSSAGISTEDLLYLTDVIKRPEENQQARETENPYYNKQRWAEMTDKNNSNESEEVQTLL